MKIYAVGGSIRDQLLGIVSKDKDYVVVGSTPEEMTSLGFKSVGRDFPVFLHPRTHEEYALARTERKISRGYHGFNFFYAPDVTLEEDLARRDFTINAMAREVKQDGSLSELLVDPYHGQQDLAQALLRHVSPAFVEDPVRILRCARFAARFANFSIAKETVSLMQHMVQTGEVDALVPERIWQELARGLMEDKPSRMFEVLRSVNALSRIFPEIENLFGVPQNIKHHPEVDTGLHVMMVLDQASKDRLSLPGRFAALMHDVGKGKTPIEHWPRHPDHEQRGVQLIDEACQRLRVPKACHDIARIVAREHGQIHRSMDFNAEQIVQLLERCDAFRKPERFDLILKVCIADARGRLGCAEQAYPQAQRLRRALKACEALDSKAVIQPYIEQGEQGGEVIKAAIYEARIQALLTNKVCAELKSATCAKS